MIADGNRPAPYIVPLAVRGRISRAQPKGLPVINLGFNELPYGPSPKVAEAMAACALRANYYGSPGCDALRAALGTANGLDPETIICGNGSEELLDVIARNFARPGDEILISQFGYIQFEMSARRLGATLVKAPETAFTTDVDALLGAVTDRTRLVFLANPNNPTGTVLPVAELDRLARGLPSQTVLVLDLAYGEFTGFEYCASVHALAQNHDNVVVTRTFSKAYGLAGLRVGWAHAPEWMLPGFYAARGMGSVNAMAQAAATAALGDIGTVHERVALIVAERDRVAAALAKLGISSLPSGTNFLLVTIDGAGPDRTEALVEYLFDEAGIIVTRTREAGLEHYLRFSIGLPEQNDLLIERMTSFLECGGP
ncbi:MAG: histidinol-phosphate aminotransferase [Paracoccaceae bacterium]|jgi:histidinol-phosphate aminotransferase